MSERYDDAVIGAGIMGLAHAYHLAKCGRRVIVFERGQRAQGASIRNFGMLWPIGQPQGIMHRTALRSREIWLEALEAAGIWHEKTGSLHLAYHDDEAQVLQEFAGGATAGGFECELLRAEQTLRKSPVVKSEGLVASLWSETEICVDPREVVSTLPDFLTRKYDVQFQFGCAVTQIGLPILYAGGRTWEADRAFVCTGDDFQTLYPEVYAHSGLTRCKLQMMRSQPYGKTWHLGPMLAAGLTLRHYKSFQDCPTLPALKARYAAEMPQFDRYGIHVLASQNGRGEVVLGDSHEYDGDIEPFDKPEIDDLVLGYLNTFLAVPNLEIAARWHGIYSKHPTEPYFTASPAPEVRILTGVGGAGMTLSFGLAERMIGEAGS